MTVETETVLRLVSHGDGEWVSEDGRVRVVRDDTYETFCEEPHPVRYRLDTLSEGEVKRLPYDAKYSEKRTKAGWVKYVSYECPGDESHFYSMWTTEIDGDWTDDVFYRFDHALEALEKLSGMRVVRVNRKRERTRATEIDPVTGAARWAKCGHRAELDINEDCYTCHESVLV